MTWILIICQAAKQSICADCWCGKWTESEVDKWFSGIQLHFVSIKAGVHAGRTVRTVRHQTDNKQGKAYRKHYMEVSLSCVGRSKPLTGRPSTPLLPESQCAAALNIDDRHLRLLSRVSAFQSTLHINCAVKVVWSNAGGRPELSSERARGMGTDGGKAWQAREKQRGGGGGLY